MYKKKIVKEPYYFLKKKNNTKSLTNILSNECLDFLDTLSKELISSKETKINLDFFSFAIWLRKKNLRNIISENKSKKKSNSNRATISYTII